MFVHIYSSLDKPSAAISSVTLRADLLEDLIRRNRMCNGLICGV